MGSSTDTFFLHQDATGQPVASFTSLKEAVESRLPWYLSSSEADGNAVHAGVISCTLR